MNAGRANVGDIEKNVSRQLALEVHVPLLRVRCGLRSRNEHDIGARRRNCGIGRLNEWNSLRNGLNRNSNGVRDDRSSTDCDIEGWVFSKAVGNRAHCLVYQL